MIYFVSTPIGNLEDITIRAINVLKNVNIIACEDTRTSQKLLNHYKISKKLFSFHKFNEIESCQKIIDLNNSGKDIAIISDAGMPIISDPGNLLTKKLREEKINFTIIPGANAALSALILSGFDASSFYFSGFMPENQTGKLNLLKKLSIIRSTLIFYISPHNLKKDIEALFKVLGKRKCSLIKEITKIRETIYSFTLGDELYFVKNEEAKKNATANALIIDLRGEFVLVVEGYKEDNDLLKTSILEHVKFYVNLGFNKNESIKKVANERHVKKDVIYKAVLKL